MRLISAVVFVPGVGQAALVEIHSQARAKEGLLDVVCGQGVAGKQHVDVAAADQLAEKLAAAGVHDRRPSDHERLSARRPIAGQIVSDLADGHPLGLLRRDVAGHKLEGLRVAWPVLDDPYAVATSDRQHGPRSSARSGPLRLSSIRIPQSISWSSTGS